MKNNTKNSIRKPITAVLFAAMMIVSVLVVVPVSAGEISVESSHPYPNNYDNTWTITQPGAAQMRIHFSRIETEPQDRIYLYDVNNNWVGEYYGTVNDMWSRWVCGDTVKVKLTSDGSYNYFGFTIDDLETRDYVPTTPIASFIYSPVSPLFVDEPIYFCARGLSYDPDGNLT